jgi:hypothetical protein
MSALQKTRSAAAQQAGTRTPEPKTSDQGEQVEYFRVKSNNGDRVALFERHEDHPNEEVLIKGDDPFIVAETPAVLRALSDRRIVYCDASGKELRTRADVQIEDAQVSADEAQEQAKASASDAQKEADRKAGEQKAVEKASGA